MFSCYLFLFILLFSTSSIFELHMVVAGIVMFNILKLIMEIVSNYPTNSCSPTRLVLGRGRLHCVQRRGSPPPPPPAPFKPHQHLYPATITLIVIAAAVLIAVIAMLACCYICGNTTPPPPPVVAGLPAQVVVQMAPVHVQA
jgi:hypothetical protein